MIFVRFRSLSKGCSISHRLFLGWILNRFCNFWKPRNLENRAPVLALYAFCDLASQVHVGFWFKLGAQQIADIAKKLEKPIDCLNAFCCYFGNVVLCCWAHVSINCWWFSDPKNL